MKKRILVFIDWFDPGYKAGGPIRSAVNFVKHMQHDYDVYVFTTDRDLGSAQAYADILVDTWLNYDEAAKVFYASPGKLQYNFIKQVLQQIQPHYVYLNSMYSRFFTIYPLLIGGKHQTVLAPRGMLKDSAIQFKPIKKKLFLQLFKWMGVPKRIVFQATDTTEVQDIQKYFGGHVQVALLSNFPGYVPPYPGGIDKKAGKLDVIFIGRLHPIKNLDFLLQLLAGVHGNIKLTVVGSEEDKAYTGRCKAMASALPAHMNVRFLGEIPNKELPVIIKEHHIFALPTKGENFGHAIFEALAAAKPVLISDQTPWRQLERIQAGWDLALNRQDLFKKALQTAVDFDQKQYDSWTRGAWEHANAAGAKNKLKESYHNLFN